MIKFSKAVRNIPKPKIRTPPYLTAKIPPTDAKKYPYENKLKINPLSLESQLNSAFFVVIQKSKFSLKINSFNILIRKQKN